MIVRDEPQPEDLAIGRDQLAEIIVLARAVDAQVPDIIPDEGSNATDDGDVEALEMGAGRALGQELSAAISSLNDDAKVDLVALAWIGRGDFDTLQEARQMARERREGPAARYLLGIPLLGDYLEEGANAVGVSVSAEESDLLHPAAGEREP